MAYGAGTQNPLIDASGNPRVLVAPGMVTTPGGLVAVSGTGPNEHRHTRKRRAGFRGPRRVSLRMPGRSGADLDAWLESYRNTGGGALGTAWWPPGESGEADAAPRWMHAQAPAFERNGANSVDITVELVEAV